ncbi:helical backbone metal receptor [Pedobacter sp. ASV28]|uniref:helical backbone metal receptor n=1 Tax=Pedobacter sp. ASV28 TaxID=2795123 RepID=UPI0018ECE91D|nr:helical backbone metal receptor [Pedobacter sp. ASV28]
MQRTVIDQLGNKVEFDYPPKRVISIVPSQTELLFDLGLDEEVVGITKFCIHPIEKFATRAKVGGTKKLRIEEIRALQPDLIIGNKEENTQEEIELLRQEFPVWMSDIHNLDEAMWAIAEIGTLVNRGPEAAYLNHLINAGFTDLQTLAIANGINQSVAYMIWKDPNMFAGRDTFINDILQKIGLRNLIEQSRYPALSTQQLIDLNPQLVFLSSEPYPFKQKHLEDIQSAMTKAKVILVDGEMFSWYGSRLVKAVQYFFEFQKELY